MMVRAPHLKPASNLGMSSDRSAFADDLKTLLAKYETFDRDFLSAVIAETVNESFAQKHLIERNSKFLKDLALIQKLYTGMCRPYFLDQNTTFNKLFEGISKGDLTDFRNGSEIMRAEQIYGDYQAMAQR